MRSTTLELPPGRPYFQVGLEAAGLPAPAVTFVAVLAVVAAALPARKVTRIEIATALPAET